jgi:8-oxo-dGTP pyrophosphatase MutT (NUDIX family)
MGAGVIPFAVHKQQVYFLFQTVFKGRKAGHYIDFGGGINRGETHQQAAAREFIEETETLFFAEDDQDIKIARKSTLRIARQLPIITKLFTQTLIKNPHWYCLREPGKKAIPKNWISYFIEFDYQDLSNINNQWELENGQQIRFSKRRELHWIEATQLLYIYQNQPKKLWKRVRQLVNAKNVIKEIMKEKLI